MKRKLTAGILVATMVLGLAIAGCGNQEKKEEIKVPEYNVDDYIELGEYKGLQIEYTGSLTVTDQEVEDQIKTILQNNEELKESKKTVVAKGDYINLDYTGKIDGEVFQGGSAQGRDIQVGSANFIDTFEDQLCGHKVGDEFDVNVTFPENYGEESLNGKPAVFTVKINAIKEKVTPILNNEFVQKVSTQSTTVAEFKKEVKASLQSQRDQSVASYNQYYAESKAIENATVKGYPTNMVEKLMADYKAAVEKVAKEQNTTYTDYLKDTFGFENESDFDEQLKKYMEQTAKINLVLEAIQKRENITLTDDEMNTAMENYAKEQGYETKEDILKVVAEEDLKKYVYQVKVLDFITANATIVEPKK